MSQKSYDKTATVYLVPTPIGNMEDITLRAINVLKDVDVIFCEDTRVTSLLLNHLNLSKKLISNHEHNEFKNKTKLLEYLKNGSTVAVVSDRGTPIISDPGYQLVLAAIENGYNVVGLPGPTALIPALISSGINPSPFLFIGFLNNKESKAKDELNEIKNERATIIFYESPHRIIKTLEMIKEVLGNRKISISREISKKFEEIYRGSISSVISEINEIRGEMVIIVEGNKQIKDFNNLSIIQHVNLYIKEGYSEKESFKIVAKERNITKSEVYNKYQENKRT